MQNTIIFPDAQSLVSDMQSYNSFRISNIRQALNNRPSILATSVHLDKYGVLNFERDFTYEFDVCIKSATKRITSKSSATYKIGSVDSWNHYGTHDENSKWLTDDYILVDANIEQKSIEPCTIENVNIYPLINSNYFDRNRSYKRENSDTYVIVIDVNKLGVMTDNQKKAYKHLMHNISKHGYGDYQTVCYVIDTNENGFDIFNTGLYSLDSDAMLEEYHFMPEMIDFSKAEDCTNILKNFAKTL